MCSLLSGNWTLSIPVIKHFSCACPVLMDFSIKYFVQDCSLSFSSSERFLYCSQTYCLFTLISSSKRTLHPSQVLFEAFLCFFWQY